MGQLVLPLAPPHTGRADFANANSSGEGGGPGFKVRGPVGRFDEVIEGKASGQSLAFIRTPEEGRKILPAHRGGAIGMTLINFHPVRLGKLDRDQAFGGVKAKKLRVVGKIHGEKLGRLTMNQDPGGRESFFSKDLPGSGW